MAVRKIPKNYLFVTGGYASRKNESMDGFESLLEKEYLLLLDFDDSVEGFDVQPVRISVPSIPRGYVPDVLVRYRPDVQTGEIRRSELTEVKTTQDLERNDEKYAPKFDAGRQYALERGWMFRIVTETDIRTPRLSNLKFLREYRNVTVGPEDMQAVTERLRRVGGNSSSLALLSDLAPTDDEKLRWIPVIWSMVLNKHLVTDLDEPFTGDVAVAFQETFR